MIAGINVGEGGFVLLPVGIFEPSSFNDNGRQILLELLSAFEAKKPAALTDALLAEFGTLARVLAAGTDAQYRVVGDRPEILRFFALMRDAMLHALKAEISEAPVFSDSEAVLRYLHVAMEHELREQVRVLFLDSASKLIRDEVLWTGTVSAASCYPREVIRRALELGATILVLAHNHPSGNLAPSDQDIQITRAIMDSGRHLDVTLKDHLIIGRSGHTSLREKGLI